MHDSMHAQPPMPSFSGTTHRRMMMHMTFYWGDSAEILFSGWPGRDEPVMYGVSLTFVFVLAVLVEWLSHCRFRKPGAKDVSAGLLRTGLYTVRSGLSYMLMFAVMSFNGGVFLAAVGGHLLGFLVFGSRAFPKSGGSSSEKLSDLPPGQFLRISSIVVGFEFS